MSEGRESALEGAGVCWDTEGAECLGQVLEGQMDAIPRGQNCTERERPWHQAVESEGKFMSG